MVGMNAINNLHDEAATPTLLCLNQLHLHCEALDLTAINRAIK